MTGEMDDADSASESLFQPGNDAPVGMTTFNIRVRLELLFDPFDVCRHFDRGFILRCR